MKPRSIYLEDADWQRVDKLAKKHIRDNGQMTRVLILKGLEFFEKRC